MVYAAPGKLDGITFALDTSVPWTAPEFVLPLDSETIAYAYPLTVDQVRSNPATNSPGWFFVFSEPVTGPRFRFEESTRVSAVLGGFSLGPGSPRARIRDCGN